MRPLASKLGLNPGMRALVLASPPGYIKSLMPLAHDLAVSSRAQGTYEFVQVFATRLAEVREFAKKLPKHAPPNALVWICYPKKTSGSTTNLSRDIIREVLSGARWRAVSIIAIDEVWSALRFRPARQVGSRSKRNPT
jgi:hypothetical protein